MRYHLALKLHPIQNSSAECPLPILGFENYHFENQFALYLYDCINLLSSVARLTLLFAITPIKDYDKKQATPPKRF